MSINAVSSGSSLGVQSGAGSTYFKGKKSLDDLEAALKAGDVEAAKAAFSQFQASAPTNRPANSSTVGDRTAALGQALASDDLSAAQSAVDDLKRFASQRIAPGSGKPAGGPPPGGPPPGAGAGGGEKSKESDDKKILDEADTNHDGKVSLQEQIAYEQKLKARAEKEKAEAEKKRAAAANAIGGGSAPATSGYTAGYTAASSGLSVGTGDVATSGAVDVVA